MDFYDIDGNPLEDPLDSDFAVSLLSDSYRLVAKTTFNSEYMLSTIFLGYAFEPDPELFETAIIDPDGQIEILQRHKSIYDAYRYHRLLVNAIVDGRPNFIVREIVHERFLPQQKQDYTIHT